MTEAKVGGVRHGEGGRKASGTTKLCRDGFRGLSFVGRGEGNSGWSVGPWWLSPRVYFLWGGLENKKNPRRTGGEVLPRVFFILAQQTQNPPVEFGFPGGRGPKAAHYRAPPPGGWAVRAPKPGRFPLPALGGLLPPRPGGRARLPQTF